MASPPSVPIMEAQVQECEFSARFWATEIGRYAQTIRSRADTFAIASALLSTLTGLGVWSTLATSTDWPIVLLVSVVALTAAAVATIPKIKGYAECAQAAALLGPRYGHALGELRNALAMLRCGDPDGPSRAAKAVEEFEQVRQAKEALTPYPTALADKVNVMRAKAELGSNVPRAA